MSEHPQRLVDWGVERLIDLARATGNEGATAKGSDAFRFLSSSFESRTIEDVPARSARSLSLCPFNFSLAFSPDRTALRFEVETQTFPSSVARFSDATASLLARLAEAGRPSDRIARVRDALGQHWQIHPGARIAGERVAYKIYISKFYRHREAMPWQAGLEALGLGDAAEPLALALREDPSLDVHALGVEVGDEGEPCVELYVTGPKTTDEAFVERMGRIARDHVEGDFTTFVRSVIGRSPWMAEQRPMIFSYLVRPEGPTEPTCFISMPTKAEGIALDDEAIVGRVETMFRQYALDPQPYLDAVRLLSSAAPARGRPGHCFVAMRRDEGRPRPSVYFDPDVFGGRYAAAALARVPLV